MIDYHDVGDGGPLASVKGLVGVGLPRPLTVILGPINLQHSTCIDALKETVS